MPKCDYSGCRQQPRNMFENRLFPSVLPYLGKIQVLFSPFSHLTRWLPLLTTVFCAPTHPWLCFKISPSSLLSLKLFICTGSQVWFVVLRPKQCLTTLLELFTCASFPGRHGSRRSTDMAEVYSGTEAAILKENTLRLSRNFNLGHSF